MLLLPALLAVLCCQAQLDIRQLYANFYVYTTYKPIQGRAFPSNSMYVLGDSGVVMIDTPWDSTQTQPLLDSIESRHHQKVIACIVTHAHDDRTAGLGLLKRKGIRTYSTLQSQQLGLAKGEQTAAFTFDAGACFYFGNIELHTFYPGEGHTADNIVVWFPHERILYGGCFVKSVESGGLGNIADANLQAWPQSIQKVMKQYPRIRFIIPGHQGWHSRKALRHTLKLLKRG